ncbi:MAG: DNA-binding MarR family transcriptional regulator [Arenicella sp.]|jgi:DNA-binding MarR family transcriptional regulator
MSESNLAASFLIGQSFLHSKLQRKVDGQLSLHGISFTEYQIMHHLASASEQTMRRIELADCVGISASGVTRLLAPMEKNHLIEKRSNPRDARVSSVKLSQVGATLFEDASVSFRYCAEDLTSMLSTKQLENLIDLSNRLITAA